MSENSRKIRAFSPALGLVFGGSAAMIIAIIADLNIPIAMIFGTAIGLVIGSIIK